MKKLKLFNPYPVSEEMKKSDTYSNNRKYFDSLPIDEKIKLNKTLQVSVRLLNAIEKIDPAIYKSMYIIGLAAKRGDKEAINVMKEFAWIVEQVRQGNPLP